MKLHQLHALNSLIQRLDVSTPHGVKTRSIVLQLASEASGIFELETNPDPMKSPVANDLLTNAERSRLRDKLNAAKAELIVIVAEERSAQAAARIAKANLVPNEHAAEIRAVFRELNYSEKMEFLSTAIKFCDAGTVAAITEAPAVLTGLQADQVQKFRESFLESVAPNRTDETDELQAICDTSLQMLESIARPVGAQQNKVPEPDKPTAPPLAA